MLVIDVSGSMQQKAGTVDPRIAGSDRRYPRRGTRFQVARYELRKAIDRLPPEAKFNIVYFNSAVRIFRETGLISGGKKDKQAVSNWLRYRLRTYGGTRMYDALARGLTEPVDTVYFLTDGTPTSGRLKDPAEILTEISLRNQQLGVKLHVVAVGQKVDVGFLRALAERNRGTFLHTHR